MNIQHRGVTIDFHKGIVRKNSNHMTFKFRYKTNGIEMEECGKNQLPAYVIPFIEKNAADYLWAGK